MSRRQVAATIVVVALVALAGCSFGGGSSDGGDGTPTAAETTAPPEETATATATPTATPTPESTGDVYEAAISEHRSQLANQDGVAMSLVEEEHSDDGDSSASGTILLDLSTEELFADISMTLDGNEFKFEQYSPPNSDRMQTCTFGGGECSLRSNQTDGDHDAGVTTPVTQIAELEEPPDFEDRGVVQTDQGERRKLVAEGTEAVTNASVDYESFRMVLFFDPETGLLQKMVYEATFSDAGVTTEKSLTVSYEYRAVDIEQPDWYIEEDE